jgi:hypothetical protein
MSTIKLESGDNKPCMVESFPSRSAKRVEKKASSSAALTGMGGIWRGLVSLATWLTRLVLAASRCFAAAASAAAVSAALLDGLVVRLPGPVRGVSADLKTQTK